MKTKHSHEMYDAENNPFADPEYISHITYISHIENIMLKEKK